jgi:cell division protein FtsQ
LQSVSNSPVSTLYDWNDEVRFFRASRQSFSRGAQAMFAAAREAPEQSPLHWFETHANLLSRLGFAATLLFWGLAAAYAISLSGRWDEMRRTGLKHANDMALAAGLGITDVTVDGNANVTRAEITEALGGRNGISIFTFDTAGARARILRNGWVREARVMRLLPATLVVEVEERAPFAIWREGGESVAIDASGRVLGKALSSAFPALPVLSGPGAATPAKEIVEWLRAVPELHARVRDIERIAGRRWDLLLDTGLRAKLPAGHAKAALADLNEIVAKNPAALYEISEIDLRVSSQFTLRLKDASEDGRKKFLSWFSKARPGREGTL